MVHIIKHLLTPMLAVITFLGYSQSTSVPAKLDVPITLKHGQFLNGQELYDTTAEGRSMNTAGFILEIGHIFPVGLSKDGKFAFITQPPQGERGSYYVLNVYDLQLDTMLYTKDTDIDIKNTIDTYWGKNYKTIDSVLKSYNVSKYNNWSLIPPDSLPGKFVFRHKEIKKAGMLSTRLYQDVGTVQSVIGKPIRYHEENRWGFEVAGFISTPSSPHKALLYKYINRWACGGPPAYQYLSVFGTE